jgi:hypothetical protein
MLPLSVEHYCEVTKLVLSTAILPHDLPDNMEDLGYDARTPSKYKL